MRSDARSPRILMLAMSSLLLIAASAATARQGEPPFSLTQHAKRMRAVPIVDAGAIDPAQRRIDADARARTGAMPTKRLQTAEDIDVAIDSSHEGTWELLDDGSRLWRERVRVAGATDMRLAFDRFALPAGATLYVIGANDYFQGPYTRADALDGTFHSPVVPGDSATIELRVPPGTDSSAGVAISRVGAGFRDLFAIAQGTGPGASGACNVNVACPLGQSYADEVRAVAYYEFDDDQEHATFICSGSLIADAPHDRRNYFLSAAHCVASASEASSMVVYWNYQSTQCNALSAPAGGFFNDDQHGAVLRATRADADFTLVELSTAPESAWDVYYAGWDATGAAPSGTIGIHHPSGDVKKITAGPSPHTIDSCIGEGTNTHWETGPYLEGTTEGGSSGSGLFVANGTGGGHDRLLIGTLSGGLAACSASNPSQPNDETDCYGKLSSAWNGASAAARLRDWLDPAQTGALTAAGIDSEAANPVSLGHSHHARPPRPGETRN